MSSHIEPSVQTPDIGCLLSHFLRQVEGHHVKTPSRSPLALHYQPKTQSLAEYPWPLDPTTKRRIPPSELEAFRRTHIFTGPCCLCSYLEGGGYTEARIAIVSTAKAGIGGETHLGASGIGGEYVAVCARQRCGYFLCLERFYPLDGLRLRVCRKRAAPLPVEDLSIVSILGKESKGGGGLVQIIGDTFARGPGDLLRQFDIEARKKAHLRRVKVFGDGVPQDMFWGMFVQCIACKLVMFADCCSTHTCQHQLSNVSIDMDLSSRHHPYHPRPLRVSRFGSRFGRSIGDHPEVTRARSLRLSPVPTEVDHEDADDNLVAGSPATRGRRRQLVEEEEREVVYGEEVVVNPSGEETEVISPSDDLPSILEIFEQARSSRA
ncbi:hypothetical protein NMY22_g7399 [Coprinellus aureogranulatus]|nr:hypothetical protein NMY22_g7399 [Coprinellus aureogranulatus]